MIRYGGDWSRLVLVEFRWHAEFCFASVKNKKLRSNKESEAETAAELQGSAAEDGGLGVKMYYVYVLKSKKDPAKIYVGLTKDLENRLKEHNAGESVYSKNLSPWGLETYIAFNDKQKAYELEKYLKHGSGHAFLKKRLLPNRSL